METFESKKPKLLILVTQADFGGAQRYVLDMAQGLREGWEVTVATGRDPSAPLGMTKNGLLDRAAAAGLPTIIFDHLRREINPWHDVRAVFELARYYQRERPAVVLANSSKAEVISALAGLLIRRYRSAGVYPPHAMTAGGAQGPALRARQPKLAATIHGFAFLEPVGFLRKLIYFKFQWLAGRLRDATIVLSQYEKTVALRYRIARPESLHVIPHGIGPINFLDRETARARLGLPKEKTIVGTIANLYATKGLDVLVRAWHTPPLSPPRGGGEMQVAIIGEGPERPRLERLIAEQGSIGLISLIGPIQNAAQYLKAFDLFVLPSRKEGAPYTILEALAAGLPIVATRVGAIPEMLANQKNATVVEPHDAQALGNAIRKMLAYGPVAAHIISSLADEIQKTAAVLHNLIAH